MPSASVVSNMGSAPRGPRPNPSSRSGQTTGPNPLNALPTTIPNRQVRVHPTDPAPFPKGGAFPYAPPSRGDGGPMGNAIAGDRRAFKRSRGAGPIGRIPRRLQNPISSTANMLTDMQIPYGFEMHRFVSEAERLLEAGQPFFIKRTAPGSAVTSQVVVGLGLQMQNFVAFGQSGRTKRPFDEQEMTLEDLLDEYAFMGYVIHEELVQDRFRVSKKMANIAIRGRAQAANTFGPVADGVVLSLIAKQVPKSSLSTGWILTHEGSAMHITGSTNDNVWQFVSHAGNTRTGDYIPNSALEYWDDWGYKHYGAFMRIGRARDSVWNPSKTQLQHASQNVRLMVESQIMTSLICLVSPSFWQCN